MISLHRDPLGERIFEEGKTDVSEIGPLGVGDKDQRLLELEARIRELEKLQRESTLSYNVSE